MIPSAVPPKFSALRAPSDLSVKVLACNAASASGPTPLHRTGGSGMSYSRWQSRRLAPPAGSLRTFESVLFPSTPLLAVKFCMEPIIAPRRAVCQGAGSEIRAVPAPLIRCEIAHKTRKSILHIFFRILMVYGLQKMS